MPRMVLSEAHSCENGKEAVVEKRESYETGTMDLTRQDYDVVFSPG